MTELLLRFWAGAVSITEKLLMPCFISGVTMVIGFWVVVFPLLVGGLHITNVALMLLHY